MTDILIKQGTDSGYTWPLFNTNGTPMTLTGYKVYAQARSLNGVLLYQWSTDDGNAFIQANKVYIFWNHGTTSAWNWSVAKYDLEIVSAENTVTRIDSGAIKFSKEITSAIIPPAPGHPLIVGIDTDGTPYYSDGGGNSGQYILVDTDGVPYFSGSPS